MASSTVRFVSLFLVSIAVIGFPRCAEAVDFNYLQAGADWEDVTQFPDSQCGGSAQSPINIITADVVQFEENIAAKLKTAGIVDDAERGNVGQTFEVTFDDFVTSPDLQLPVVDGKIVGVAREPDSFDNNDDVGDTTFVQAVPEQFHFHIPSENAIDGVTFPMEAHLVTKVSQDDVSSCPDDGCFVVISILFKLGSTKNTFIDRIFDGIDTDPFDTPAPIVGPLSLDGLLPSRRDKFYSWTGSLTTPLCNEGVTWISFQDIQTVAQEQIAQLQKNFGLRRSTCQSAAGNDISAVLECNNVGDLKNNRPVQDLNDRSVFNSVEEDTTKAELEYLKPAITPALLGRAFLDL